MVKIKASSSFGWSGFFKYFALSAVLAAFSVLSILFGLNVIDIAKVSFPLAITLGGLAGVTLLFFAVFKAVGAYNAQNKLKHPYEILPYSDDVGSSDDDHPGNAPQEDQRKIHGSPLKRQKPSSSRDGSYGYLFKFTLIGDAKVGKSTLLSRFANNIFTESYISTVGVDFNMKNIKLDNKEIKLQMWDMAGQERFRPIIEGYYRGSHGILLVFDVNDERSFNNTRVWKENITKNAPEANFILVGNKCDDASKRAVSQEQAEALAKELGMTYLETSAKTGENVENCFMQLARAVYERIVESDMKRSCLLKQ